MNRGYAVLDNFLNLISILAGIGASLAAALNAPKAWAIVFGLVVGVLQSISQWLKPSQRSTRRGLAAADLRSEAWAFLQRRDRYRDKDDLTAWTLLCDQVERVEDREQSEQDKEAAQVRPAPATVQR
ncbi:MAG: SLATT domain-containing protein [Solirubrobacterales bacterium]|nr:SLATT domain-containing protein [Solirubrobacterales bacterium]